jgi:hypothetical protein
MRDNTAVEGGAVRQSAARARLYQRGRELAMERFASKKCAILLSNCQYGLAWKRRNRMTPRNVARDFWLDENVTDNQVLFELYHELALLIVPFKGYSQLLASADLSDQDRRRMGASVLESAEILESLNKALTDHCMIS